MNELILAAFIASIYVTICSSYFMNHFLASGSLFYGLIIFATAPSSNAPIHTDDRPIAHAAIWA